MQGEGDISMYKYLCIYSCQHLMLGGNVNGNETCSLPITERRVVDCEPDHVIWACPSIASLGNKVLFLYSSAEMPVDSTLDALRLNLGLNSLISGSRTISRHFVVASPRTRIVRLLPVPGYRLAAMPPIGGLNTAILPNSDACAFCMKRAKRLATPLRKCAGCSIALYCSRECQKSAWPSHKYVLVHGYVISSAPLPRRY